ncbi:ead/Ea22-like family protein [Enterobacter hormaechei]|uniref:ead/Ea22-like family protein n=1 Tax=Enterobacter hormaechei TaxID=158836 RepID=UPI003EEE376C
MSNIDKQALREMAERAASDGWGYDRDEFNDAITPDVVLALLDELEAKDKQIADLKEAFSIALSAAGIDVPTAAGKGE